MTKIDKSYMEKLGEVLYDEKKAINYKIVSLMLGVHVNIAKQMLYHLHKTGKEEGKSVYATYYVSGMISRVKLSQIGRKSDEIMEDNLTQQSLIEGQEAYLVAICKENDLEDLKAKYTKIFSVHLYSLSAFPIENCDALANLVEFPLKDNEGRSPVDFGPITCSASKQLKQKPVNARSTPVSSAGGERENKPEEKKKKPTENGEKKKEDASNNKSNETTSHETKSQKLANPLPKDNKNDANRLKSMFATAATKPKTQPNKTASSKPVSKPAVQKSFPAEEIESKFQNRSNKDKETRKRKRIRDVLSSDSEEEQTSPKKDDSNPPSPEPSVPRKRIQIESDSDDDFKESPKKADKVIENESKKVVAGRKRVAKLISKTYVDKDGFLVTTKEQVMVSEDEDTTEKKVKVESAKEVNKAAVKTSPTEGGIKEASKAKNGVSKNVAGKTKQASLMSFFQKK